MADIAALTGNLSTEYIQNSLNATASGNRTGETETSKAFSSLLDSALKTLEETNTLANNADTAQMNFAMGYSDNTHDLVIAQQKAALSLQYTVAIKNQLISAYKEIMNIQI